MDFAYGNAVREGDRFTLGTLELFILETPGHTEESITVVLVDAEVSREPYMVFSGDTLFAGDIARTDFFGPTRKAEMAGKIYDSISTKILPLGDGVILCPAHGAGSACGSEIADHPFSTIGYERRANPVLALKKDAFIARRTTESPYLPPYFRQMEIVNKDGPALLNTLPRPQPLPVAAVASLIISGCQIVDIRSPTSFAAGHIPGSLSLWRDGIASFAGWYLDYTRPIVFVDDFTCNPDAVIRHFVRMGTILPRAGWPAGFLHGSGPHDRSGRPGPAQCRSSKNGLPARNRSCLTSGTEKTGSASDLSRVRTTCMSASSRSTSGRSQKDGSLSYTAIPDSKGALRQACLRCTDLLT